MKGFPSGRDAFRMMQKMGMNAKEVDNVEEVVIRTTDRIIKIEKPSVTSIKMQEQNMFQIAGGIVKEDSVGDTSEVTTDDIKLVMEQTGKNMETVKQALVRNDGDLAKAILELKEENS